MSSKKKFVMEAVARDNTILGRSRPLDHYPTEDERLRFSEQYLESWFIKVCKE